ncbi:MAG: hypothetical protein VCD00_11170 [Candidatus Hydrogenedentota bacterium]
MRVKTASLRTVMAMDEIMNVRVLGLVILLLLITLVNYSFFDTEGNSEGSNKPVLPDSVTDGEDQTADSKVEESDEVAKTIQNVELAEAARTILTSSGQLRQESELLDILKNEHSMEEWDWAAAQIALIYPSNTGAETIMDYLRRNDDYSGMLGSPALLRKAEAFRWLGNIRYAKSEEFLLRMLEEESARQELSKWIDKPLPEPWNEIPDELLYQFMARAAIGLALNGKMEYQDVIEERFKRLTNRLLDDPMFTESREFRSANATEEHKMLYSQYGAWLSAMAEIDYLREHGEIAYIRLYSEHELGGQYSRLSPYLDKRDVIEQAKTSRMKADANHSAQ